MKPSNPRLDLFITLLGLAGIVLFLSLYDSAFPSAAIDLTLSRDEIARRAEAYIQAQGYDVEGYEFALTFDESGWASVYLQRTVGIPETNRLIRDEGVPIYYWRARWFKPLQKEEFSASLAPDGNVVAFSHSVPEDRPGAALEQEQARVLAEGYATGDRGWSLAGWELTSASSQDRPGGRVDHHFEWKQRDWSVGDSEMRIAVDVQGDRIGGYGYWLKTPESFDRQFLEQRNRAGFVNNLSYTIGFYGFIFAAVAALVAAAWRSTLNWRAGLKPALLVGVVSLLASLNYLPLAKAGYGTTQDYALFWIQRVFNIVVSAGYDAALVYLLWLGGKSLARRVWPRQDKILPRSDDRRGTLARSAWRGLMLGGMSGGYVILFYLIATRLFGGWTPLQVSSASTYATPLPFLGPIETGLTPAMTEELVFRLVGIALVLLWTRRRWLALLIPGVLWAFAHLGYVRDPFYLRGIELTIEAVLLTGLFFLRFDLITTITAHFAYNASLGALPLLRSGEPYFVASGLIVVAAMLAPLLPGVAGGLRRLRHTQARIPQPRVDVAAQSDLPRLLQLPVEGVDWPALFGDPNTWIMCLRASDTVIGVAAGRMKSEDTAEITVVYVDPAWRRRYWGSALIDDLAGRMCERGVRTIEVTAASKDRTCIGFWASQGWRPTTAILSKSFALKEGQRKGSFFRRIRESLTSGEEIRI